MHELSVTQGILNVVLEVAKQNGGQRITAIDLVIGELTSMVDDSVQFYFNILSKGTLAEGAALRFRREPPTATCQNCGHQFVATLPLLSGCPTCASARVRITGGTQFYVESIEVEDEASSGQEDPERERSDRG